MPFKIVIKPEAEKELLEALEWYDLKKDNLGTELFIEISKVLDTIKENPNLFQKRYKIFRVSFTKKFQYGIHYTLENNTIFVHAILHTSQKLPK
ncbi:MAG: toxin ParE1/3/4 [Polaribacter sp.]|jgi:toxin ParE1/3/4